MSDMKCPYCNSVFETRRELTQHMPWHYPKMQEPIIPITEVDRLQAMVVSLRATLAKQQEVIGKLVGYASHDSKCILGRNNAGRPMADGKGYELQYDDRWYPSDNLPSCECGLDTILSSLDSAESEKVK